MIRRHADPVADMVARRPSLCAAPSPGRPCSLPPARRRGRLRVAAKAESLQLTGSFKVRGALNRGARTSAAERAAGLITISAGNAALGAARGASTERGSPW
jgi:threonine dehydratase